MVIVRLSGGLGNQLFQYALAKALMEKNHSNVKIDASFLRTSQVGLTKRTFLLNRFNITVPEATTHDLLKLGVSSENYKLKSFFIRIFEKILPRMWRTIIYDTRFQYDSDVIRIKGEKYLMGNWLSPKYFTHIRDFLIKDLTLKEPLSKKAQEVLHLIEEENSVSVHVRRGDFLQYPKLSVCEPKYYEKAMTHITSKLQTPSFFIFSDDIKYVKEYIDFNGYEVKFVSGRGFDECEELILMSHCKHNVIANSSFSWWAAWLNQNQEKIIIAPKVWRADEKDVSDYVPEELNWIRL